MFKWKLGDKGHPVEGDRSLESTLDQIDIQEDATVSTGQSNSTQYNRSTANDDNTPNTSLQLSQIEESNSGEVAPNHGELADNHEAQDEGTPKETNSAVVAGPVSNRSALVRRMKQSFSRWM